MIIIKRNLYFVIMLLFLTGCSNNIEISNTSITNVTYENITINSKDYDKFIGKLDNLNLSKRKVNDTYKKSLKITDSQGVHTLEFSNKNTMRYSFNNQIYYSKNIKTISYIISNLDSVISKYQQRNFFSFKVVSDYKESNSDLIIKLDNVNQHFRLNSSMKIKDFTIHKVEKRNNEYHDIDYIYNKKKVESNNIIIRMNPLKDYYTYRISFTNEHGMNVSIIPSYDNEKETGELKYIINYQFINK